jgi:hypothetical protein
MDMIFLLLLRYKFCVSLKMQSKLLCSEWTTYVRASAIDVHIYCLPLVS